MKKILKIISIIVVIGAAAYFGYRYFFNSNDNIQQIYLVPKDAVYIFETEEPIDNWETISESAIWKHLKTNSYFNELTENLNTLDTLFKEKKGLFNTIGERDITISAHVYAPKKYSFLYIVDLQKMAKLNIVKNNISSLISDGFRVSKRKYHNHEITEIYNKDSRETIYLSYVKNQVLVSFVHTLVEASIDEYSKPSIGRDLSFVEVSKSVGYNDMFRLYVQHNYLNNLLKVYSNQNSAIADILIKNFDFTGFSFDLDDNLIEANSLTVTKPEANNYIKAMQKSGVGERSISEIAPQNTSAFIDFSFESFETFYENFEAIQQENEQEFKTYLDRKEKIENYLDIDFKTNFTSWIDDEMAIVQMHSTVSNTKDDVALIIKASNVDDATENLNFISNQIRKKSPVKFKTITYKDYPINYLSVKGFFNVLLGKYFKSFEKPYYTIIDDYVIFSNKPNTLKSIINNYIADNTLSNTASFENFNDEFNDASNMFVYINTLHLYNTLYSFMDTVTRSKLRSNKDYIVCFNNMGLQLSPTDNAFESKLIVEYSDAKTLKLLEATIKNNSITETVATNITVKDSVIPEINDRIFDIAEIFPSDLTAKIYKHLNTDGTLDYEVELKDGLPHGKYESYHSNGKLKISGKFRSGKQKGVWRYFNTESKQQLKKRF